MTTAQTPAAVRSNAAKKGAATRAAKAATKAVVEGPAGKPMPDAQNLPEVPQEQRQGERRQAEQNLAQQFAPTEQTTPAVHDTPAVDAEALKLKAFQEAVQAIANSMGVPVPPLDAAQPAKQGRPRADKQVQNNITRPAAGSITGSIWEAADKISATKGGQGFASIAELRALPELRQTNEATLKTQYARWRTYHGLKGRQAAPAPEQKPIPEGRDDGIENAFKRRHDDPKPAAE